MNYATNSGESYCAKLKTAVKVTDKVAALVLVTWFVDFSLALQLSTAAATKQQTVRMAAEIN